MLETVARGFKAARNKLQGRTEITAEVVDALRTSASRSSRATSPSTW
jgi:hypothetical protein